MNSLQILILAITLIAAAVGVVWGFKRYRYLKYARIKTRLRYQTSGEENLEEDFGSELPGGGSRVIGHRDPEDIHTVNKRIREQAEANKPKLSTSLRSPSEQEALDLGLDQNQENDPHIPVLLDPTDEVGDAEPSVDEPPAVEAPAAEAPAAEAPIAEVPIVAEQTVADLEENTPTESDETEDLSDNDRSEEVDHSILFSDPVTTEKHPGRREQPAVSEAIAETPQAPEPEVESADAIEKLPEIEFEQAAGIEKESEAEAEAEAEAENKDELDEVIIINLMCTEHGDEFQGTELKAALEGQGLQLGNMDIFHFDSGTGSETIRFSAANILNPGTFPKEKIEYFYTPGICFFMTMTPGVSNLQAFNQLLGAARGVASKLGGELKDQERNYLTHQRVEEIRIRMGDFQRENLPG